MGSFALPPSLTASQPLLWRDGEGCVAVSMSI